VSISCYHHQYMYSVCPVMDAYAGSARPGYLVEWKVGYLSDTSMASYMLAMLMCHVLLPPNQLCLLMCARN